MKRDHVTPGPVRRRARRSRGPSRRRARRQAATLVLAAFALGSGSTPAVSWGTVTGRHVPTAERAAGGERAGSSLEAAASRAGTTGRAVALSLIGLAFAVAGTVLAFRRDFREAAGVFAVGIIAVLLATPAGMSLLRDTVSSLFGA